VSVTCVPVSVLDEGGEAGVGGGGGGGGGVGTFWLPSLGFDRGSHVWGWKAASGDRGEE
jgi:hypothetical protein